MEAGETLEDALARELGEELGVTPTACRKLAEIDEPNPTTNGQARYHIYLVTAWTGGEPRMLGDEHVRIEWFRLSQAAALDDLALAEYRDLFALADRVANAPGVQQ